MEIKVLENTKKRLKIEMLENRHTLPHALTKELWNDKDVKISGYRIEHPYNRNPTLVVETDGDAKKALLGAIDRLKKQNKEFSSKIKEIAQ
ncbi:hypothetical protein HY643_02830 [Candidatus Woesearchaeota archaeon]|nr:hypothetical protein [Candidatus Woesearchaeota archaeon]